MRSLILSVFVLVLFLLCFGSLGGIRTFADGVHQADESGQREAAKTEKKSDAGAKIIVGNKTVEAPIFGVRFVPERCTAKIASNEETKKIRLAYVVYRRPLEFTALSLRLQCTRVSADAREALPEIKLPLPNTTDLRFYEFTPSGKSAHYYFLLKLTPTKPGLKGSAFSQLFVCDVQTDNQPFIERSSASAATTLKIKHHKYKPYIEREPSTARLFYKINFELNLEIENPLLPIVWKRTVKYSPSPFLPAYLKGAFPPVNTPMDTIVKKLYSLPPAQIQHFPLKIRLTFISEMFPVAYSQSETIALGKDIFRLVIDFTTPKPTAFPPDITVKLLKKQNGKFAQTQVIEMQHR